MAEKSYRLYPYRWVVLAVFMLINLTIQILWISYAPITGLAAKFYGVTDLNIGLLAMVYMMAFIPLSIPVSWAIDTYGFRRTVSIGAVLMGIFGVVRGLGWSRLFTGADQYDRDCHCAAIFTQCMDKGAGAVVQHRGTGNSGWTGHPFQPGGYCPGNDPSADPDRNHVHPSITATVRWSCCDFSGPFPDLCTGKTRHAALPGWTGSPCFDAGWLETRS